MGYETTAGTRIFYGDTKDAVNVELAEVKNVGDLPEVMADEFDVTRVYQVDEVGDFDWFKRMGFGFIDPGTLKPTCGFDEDQIDTLFSILRLPKFFEIRFPSGAVMAFPGTVKGNGGKTDIKDEIVMDITIRVTGKISFKKSTAGLPSSIEAGITKTGTYVGASLDLGATFAPTGAGVGLAAVLNVTAWDHTTGDETYSYQLEESSDNATFTPCGPAVGITGVGIWNVPGYVKKRYIRAHGTLGGTTPSITYTTTLRRI